MDKYYKWKVLGIVLLVALSIWKIVPPQEKIHLGLDLKGGMHLLMRVELEKIPEDAQDDALDRAVEVIRNRIDQFGVSEPVIQKQGSDQIVIQLPGVTDRERALALIGRTALLEFKRVVQDPALLDKLKAGEVVAGYELKVLKEGDRLPEELLLADESVLTGDALVNASVTFDQSGFGQPVVSLEFDHDGSRKFAQVTEQAVAELRSDGIARRLAIVLDGELRSAPQMRVVISDGRAQVEGGFSYDEANDLALVLRAGALPAPVVLEEDRIVGPTLGRDSIRQGALACVISMLLVAAFVLVYYLMPGVIAVGALFLMLILTLGGLAAFGAALTLPGIAGLILNIGMAVDANVLIFERIREEVQTGKTMRSSISAGYNRAFSAIFDANLTTFITAMVLFYFGTGPIKGFAVTLSIGIVASMLTALVVTRLIFDALTRRQNSKVSLRMLNMIGTTPQFNYLSKKRIAYAGSLILIVAGMVLFVVRGEKNYGVDFAGGFLEQVRFENPVNPSEVRKALVDKGLSNTSIQRLGDAADGELLLRSAGSDPAAIHEALKGLGDGKGYEILRSEFVGPAAGAAIRGKAIKAFFFALLAIVLYTGWRFKARYGLCAVVALFHDALICVAFLVFTGREISLPVVAAILAVMGYSLNDTIVIFDRLRENVKNLKKKPFDQLVNLSINQTLSRSILTSLTTLIVAVVLFLFGGTVINDFAFTLIVGVIAGTYSTIFIAAALLADWQRVK